MKKKMILIVEVKGEGECVE